LRDDNLLSAIYDGNQIAFFVIAAIGLVVGGEGIYIIKAELQLRDE
jgi:hypothetical protein